MSTGRALAEPRSLPRVPRMADKTGIEWTDTTWNPIVGCSVVSPGCANCYAMRTAGTRLDREGGPARYRGTTQLSKAGPVWTGKVHFAPDAVWTAPLRWRRPRRVFVNSMGDLFHEAVPDGWIDRVFAVMALAPQHTFQVLTKRAKRMRAYFASAIGRDGSPLTTARNVGGICIEREMQIREAIGALQSQFPVTDPIAFPLPNVWLGVSTEDQARADERIPDLLATPAAVRFVSAEPLLGPIDFTRWIAIDWQCSCCHGFFSGRHRPTCPDCGALGGWSGSHIFNGRGTKGFRDRGSGLDWVIVGGESGPKARPMHPDWARSIRDQCIAAGVPFFFKQWGEWADQQEMARADPPPPGSITIMSCPRFSFSDSGPHMWRIGKRDAGRLLDGRTWDEFPSDGASAAEARV